MSKISCRWLRKLLQECEMYTSKICGTWTLEGDHYIAKWDNGAVATLNVEYWVY